MNSATSWLRFVDMLISRRSVRRSHLNFEWRRRHGGAAAGRRPAELPGDHLRVKSMPIALAMPRPYSGSAL